MTYKRNIPFIALIFFTIFITGSCRKSNFIIEPSNIVISDNGGGTGTTTWIKGKEYLLEGRIFVNDGQVLTIEPGAVIRFKSGKGAGASALIVARGGKIMAEGTSANPIIFTAEKDDLSGSLAIDEFGMWGGVIILGDAAINTPTGESHVEGIPLSEPRGVFGGHNNNDNSGVLKYVSIRYAGTELSADNEINSLTLGGVGQNTIIENVEVFANADDGIEIFGGTVNLKRIVVTYSDDDAIDIDLGYQGTIQFACLIQHEHFGDKLFEIDGGEIIKTAHPYTLPQIYNITAVGRGTGLTNSCISFWDNAGGTIANSIFINQGHGIEMEYSESRHSSYSQWEIGNLQFQNNIFHQIHNDVTEGFFKLIALNDEIVNIQEQYLENYFTQAGNRFVNPGFTADANGYSLFSESQVIRENLSPIPVKNSFLEEVPFKGAFGDYNWMAEWTLTDQLGLVW